MYNDSSDLYTTFCALIMALWMLKKSKVAEQAIEKKDHKASKSLLQKALVFAVIFIVIYIAWSYSLLNNSGFRGSKQLLTQIELESNTLKTQQFENNSFVKNSKYIRVGTPANNLKRNNELNFDPNYKLFKVDFKTLENEKLTRKTLHDREIAQKYIVLFQLPLELPLLILIALVTLYLGIKLSIYFISFNNYSKALEKQENLNWMIVYLSTIKPIETPKIKIEEEKEIPKEVTKNVFSEPKIEEEQSELPYSIDFAINDYKIHENEMSYPVLSEFTYKA